MSIKRLLSVGFLIALTSLTAGCSTEANPSTTVPTTSDNAASEKIMVTTSISPLQDLIAQVGGDRVQVTSLVPTGSDPHDFSPKPEDVRKVAESSIFFANGIGQEQYLEDLVQNAGNPDLQTVVLSDGLTVLGQEDGSLGNPHLWLDVQNTKIYVEKIRDVLSAASPENKEYFDQNATAYLAELDELDSWIRSEISTIPVEDRDIVVFHDAWAYYANQYGLNLLRPMVYNGESEPSTKEYAELVDLIKEYEVKAVFAEAGFNSKIVEQLAQDSGAKFVDDLYDDTLGDTPETDSYIEVMKMNTEAIVSGLR